MALIDWIVLGGYIALIVGMGWLVGRRQRSQEDYYLGGRRMPPWQIALSVVATQVSAISLIGAPAFIALRAGGGLIWLQYEFAVPLAMILIMLLLVPLYHRTGAVTIYEYLERRFGCGTRCTISAVFLLSRGLGSGVALLATGIVTAVCLDWPLADTILVIGGVAIVYTTFGGIVADIYSDILQMIILWGGALLTIGLIWSRLEDGMFRVMAADAGRLQIFDLGSWGLGDGGTFGFWPMLIGGFFLYLSYYGCDQSQTQRLLTTRTIRESQKALLVNGLLRFPLVLTYCAVGVLLLPFLESHPAFAARLQGQPPDFLVPYFIIDYIPVGVRGILVAGFFAASMSSIDSALNSLSAVSYRDFLMRWFPRLESLDHPRQVRISRLLTVFWGMVATGFALWMIGGSETVLELVNKVGSAFYGPILAVFCLGMLTRRARQHGVIAGLGAGVGLNVSLWLFAGPAVSWLWWNLFGFLVAVGVGSLVSRSGRSLQLDRSVPRELTVRIRDLVHLRLRYIPVLLVAFVVFMMIALLIQHFLLGVVVGR